MAEKNIPMLPTAPFPSTPDVGSLQPTHSPISSPATPNPDPSGSLSTNRNSVAPASMLGTPTHAAPAGKTYHDLSHAMIGSILGTLAGPPDPSSYSIDPDTGKQTANPGDDGRGSQIRRIARSALMGLAAGASVPQQKSPLAAGLAGAGAGFEGATQQKQKEDTVKRQQASEEFEKTQRAKLTKWTIAKEQINTYNEAVTASKMLDQTDLVSTRNQQIAKEFESYGQDHLDAPQVSYMSLEDYQNKSKDPVWAHSHHAMPVGHNPSSTPVFGPDGKPKIDPYMAVISGDFEGRSELPNSVVSELQRYNQLGAGDFGRYADLKPGQQLDNDQLGALMSHLSEARSKEMEGKFTPKIIGQTDDKGAFNGKFSIRNAYTMEPMPAFGGIPMEALKEGGEINLKNAQAKEAVDKGMEALGNYNLLMRQAGVGADGTDVSLANDPQFKQQRTQYLNNVFQAMPGARAVYGKYPGLFDELVGLAMGDSNPKDFPVMLRKGVFQLPIADAVNVVKQFLNPQYNDGLYQQKQDAIKDYTIPNQNNAAAQIISFNNFIRHSGDLHDVLKGYVETGSPLLNESFNWLRSHAAGDVKLTQLYTAISAPATEYINFLKSNRALDVADEKEKDKLISGDATIGQMRAFIEQSVPTAMDRLDNLNVDFKGRFHEDVPNLINSRSRQALDKMGMGALAEQYANSQFVRGTMAPIESTPPSSQAGAQGGKGSFDVAKYAAAHPDHPIDQVIQQATQEGYQVINAPQSNQPQPNSALTPGFSAGEAAGKK